MTKKFPASSDTTYGLFHAKIQFQSEVEVKAWKSSFLDFNVARNKEKLAPISKAWMNDYPRTTLFEETLKEPLSIKEFLQFLKNSTTARKEFFEITEDQNTIEINAYLGSYDAIEDYTELLFLTLILASENKGIGQGFLFPDNYYYDFYNFVAIKITSKSKILLECEDLQNADQDLITKLEALEPIIKQKYQKWLKQK